MRKQPVGYFIDPDTKAVVAILARNKESADVARKRVALAHNVPEASISDKIPFEAGNPGPTEVVVDLPDKPADKSPRFGKDREMNPSESVDRFSQRVAEARAPAPPSIQNLLSSPKSLPETRSLRGGEG